MIGMNGESVSRSTLSAVQPDAICILILIISFAIFINEEDSRSIIKYKYPS